MELAFQLLGALGVFLFGMKLMSEGLQKLAGEKLRMILGKMTQNRFAGLFSGIVITASIQSSTATTVMLVSFVNAGLIKLRESIGVIMGANLGTTVTAWIIAFIGFKFSLTSIALPLVGIGVCFIFFKKSNYKNFGEFVTGFGFLFMGLGYLKSSMPDISPDSEAFQWVIQYTNLGVVSNLIFLCVGLVLTFLVHSSAVMMAITITMAAKGWIPFELAAAIVLGENIGTTLTAVVAAIPANTNARRAATVHLMFNVIGVIWVMCILGFFTNMISTLIPAPTEVPRAFAESLGITDLTSLSAEQLKDLAQRSIVPDRLALFHTLFNLSNIFLLIWFVPQLEKIVTFVIKGGKDTNSTAEQRLEYLSNNFTEMGEIALFEGQKEVLHLAGISDEMFNGFIKVFQNTGQDLSTEVKRLRSLEQESDVLASQLTSFFVHCSSHELSDESIKLVTRNMIIVAELEDMSDSCYRLITFARKRYRKQFTDIVWQNQSFVEFCTEIKNFIRFMEANLKKQTITKEDLAFAFAMRGKLDSIRKRLRKEAITQMETTGATQGAVLFIEVLSQCERVGSHALNILEAL